MEIERLGGVGGGRAAWHSLEAACACACMLLRMPACGLMEEAETQVLPGQHPPMRGVWAFQQCYSYSVFILALNKPPASPVGHSMT